MSLSKNSSSVKSKVVAKYRVPVGALATKDPAALTFTTFPNWVGPNKCGHLINWVCVYKLIPNSLNVAESTTDNINLSFAVAKSTFINWIISMPLTADAWILVTLALLIVLATAIALPAAIGIKYPFNKIVRAVVTVQVDVPIITP